MTLGISDLKTRTALAIFAAMLIASLSNSATAHANQRACGEYDTSQPIQADVIVEDLKNCPVTLEDATIEGELNLGGSFEEQTTIGHNLQFNNVLVKGDADFSFTTFEGNVDFSDTTFGGDADFLLTTFEGNAVFRFATFGGQALFSLATFGGSADFSLAV